jgi:hypothetical protein
MFGYVRTHAPELRLREQTFYRAVYCGLCRSMGRACGQRSRTFLSYDLTFLALLRMAATGSVPTVRAARCFVHPLRKRPMAVPDETLLYCARAGVLLTWHKLQDDRTDEHGLKRLRALLALTLLRRGHRKAAKALPALEERIVHHLQRLSDLERDACPSVDETAAVFGDLLQELASYGLSGVPARVTAAAGAATGRWIYRMDALDDYEEDCRKNRYNPLRLQFGEAALSEETRDLLRIAMLSDLQDLSDACDLLDWQAFPPQADASRENLQGVLDNLRYLGMPGATERLVHPAAPVSPTD